MTVLRAQTVRDAASYEEACARHVWRVPALYNIGQDVCDQYADGSGRRALVWETPGQPAETYSYDDLKRLSDRVAAGLGALGIEPGMRVALMLPQTPEHAIAHIGIFKLGAVSVPLSRLFGPDALRYRLGDSGARVLLTDSENAAKVLEIWGDLPELRHVVLCDRAPGPTGDGRVLKLADVQEIYSTTGEWDFTIVIRTQDIKSLKKLVTYDLKASLPDIVRSNTLIALEYGKK